MEIVERVGERRKRVMKAFIVVLVMFTGFGNCDVDAAALSKDGNRGIRGVEKVMTADKS